MLLIAWLPLLGCEGDVGTPDCGTSLAVTGATLEPPWDPQIQHYLVRTQESEDTVTLSSSRGRFERGPGHGGVSERTEDRLDWALVPGERVIADLCDLDPITVVAVGPDWPDVTATPFGEPVPGYTALAVTDFVDRPCDRGLAAMVVDERGTPVWTRTDTRAVYDLRPAGDGELSWVAVDDDTSALVGQVLDPATGLTTRTLAALPVDGDESPSLDSHELAVLEDGRVLSLATTTHLEDLTAWGGGPEVQVVDGLVQERDADDTLLFSWSTRGHVDYDWLPQAQLDRIADGWEYAHVNSVDVDPADGHWVISLRLPSQVVKVARTDTTWQGEARAAGEVLWRLGGPGGELAFVGDDRDLGWQGYAGQHSARVLADGGLAVFDNSSHFDLGPTGDARGAIYDLDHDAGTASLRLAFALASAANVPVAGSIQERPGGGYLIGWGPAADPSGEPLGAASVLDARGGEQLRLTLPRDCWSYRAWHVEW